MEKLYFAKQTSQLLWWKKHLGFYYLSRITPSAIAELLDQLQSELTYRKRLRTPSTAPSPPSARPRTAKHTPSSKSPSSSQPSNDSIPTASSPSSYVFSSRDDAKPADIRGAWTSILQN